MVPEVVFFHKDYEKVKEIIKEDRSVWMWCLWFGIIDMLLVGSVKFTISLMFWIFLSFNAIFILLLLGGFLNLFEGNGDGRDLLPWNWSGEIPVDHCRWTEIKKPILIALRPLGIGREVFSMGYGEYTDAIDAALVGWAEEILRLERAGVGQEPVCVERRERLHSVLVGLAAQGDGCLLPLGIKNPRRYYFEAAEERLAKK